MGFTDRKGRSIEIESDYDVEAFHDGKRIGRIEFDDRDGTTTLIGMDVNEVYRRAGIATAMMREAAEIHGPDFAKPSGLATGGSQASPDSYYTLEGAAFIAQCIRLGILNDTEPRDPGDEDWD
jgi:GNAT superfamily N-acetyltransferase